MRDLKSLLRGTYNSYFERIVHIPYDEFWTTYGDTIDQGDSAMNSIIVMKNICKQIVGEENFKNALHGTRGE